MAVATLKSKPKRASKGKPLKGVAKTKGGKKENNPLKEMQKLFLKTRIRGKRIVHPD